MLSGRCTEGRCDVLEIGKNEATLSSKLPAPKIHLYLELRKGGAGPSSRTRGGANGIHVPSNSGLCWISTLANSQRIKISAVFTNTSSTGNYSRVETELYCWGPRARPVMEPYSRSIIGSLTAHACTQGVSAGRTRLSGLSRPSPLQRRSEHLASTILGRMYSVCDSDGHSHCC